MKIGDITPIVIHRWQDAMINHKDENGRMYSQTYLKTINNQMSAIMNYAVKYYKLQSNPSSMISVECICSLDGISIAFSSHSFSLFNYFLMLDTKLQKLYQA